MCRLNPVTLKWLFLIVLMTTGLCYFLELLYAIAQDTNDTDLSHNSSVKSSQVNHSDFKGMLLTRQYITMWYVSVRSGNSATNSILARAVLICVLTCYN